MTDDEDVVFKADGSMTIRGGTFAMLARPAKELGVTPEAALAGACGENTCPNC